MSTQGEREGKFFWRFQLAISREASFLRLQQLLGQTYGIVKQELLKIGDVRQIRNCGQVIAMTQKKILFSYSKFDKKQNKMKN